MKYAGFSYYHDEYGGAIISSDDEWAAYERKARRLVDMYTFGRLANKEEQVDIVKDCICEVAEAIKIFDDTAFENGGGVIASQSNDGVTIAYDSLSMSFESQNKKLYGIIYSHLANSGLMYRGM
ncbi:MAG: hypothetical protein IKV80_08340 [Bacteroidales bacterium]|nr:hypothetical protein [Bacteroidales bacterium]